MITDLWIISEDSFGPKKQYHKETIFTFERFPSFADERLLFCRKMI